MDELEDNIFLKESNMGGFCYGPPGQETKRVLDQKTDLDGIIEF